MNDSNGDIIIYQTEDGLTKINGAVFKRDGLIFINNVVNRYSEKCYKRNTFL